MPELPQDRLQSTSDPYPHNWALEYPDLADGGGYPIPISPEVAMDYGRYATHWLPNKLGEKADEIVVTRSDHRDLDEPQIYTYESQQAWGQVAKDEIARAGVSVEFGGPTPYHATDILPDFKPDFVSNITNDNESMKLGRVAVGEVDFLADAGNMPLANESVGSVKMSCIPDTTFMPEGYLNGEQESLRGMRSRAIKEAARVVKPGGFLIWDGGRKDDYELILQMGFEPKAVKVNHRIHYDSTSNIFEHPSMTINGVFQKSTTIPAVQ